LEPLIPAAKPGGRPQEIDRREIVNGILYVLRSGCPWRMIPHDLPDFRTVYLYFREWKRAGVWERVNTALRRDVRVSVGKEPDTLAQPFSTANPSKPVPSEAMHAGMMEEKKFKAAKDTCW
jgi:transposase